MANDRVIGRSKVGETLFRIHKRLLAGHESSVFASFLNLPQFRDIEGQTDERPIVLEGDSLKQFETLMKSSIPREGIIVLIMVHRAE